MCIILLHKQVRGLVMRHRDLNTFNTLEDLLKFLGDADRVGVVERGLQRTIMYRSYLTVAKIKEGNADEC